MSDVSTKASPQTVELYKTYLYRKGTRTVKQIEGIKPGEPIDLTELDNEIKAAQSVIAMCKEHLLVPTIEEEWKLKGLLLLKSHLVGKTWPSMQDIQDSVKADLEKEEKKKLALLALNKAKLEMLKTENSWILDPEAQLGKGVPYGAYAAQQKYIKWNKGTMFPKFSPSKSPVAVGAGAGTRKIEQEWIMRVGMSSGLNVTILQSNGGLGSTTILRCKVCNASTDVDNSAVVSTNVLAESIEQFCQDHRHDPKQAEPPSGRYFREE